MSQNFWMALWFGFNLFWVLVAAACGMIAMPIFNTLAAIYMLDVIMDIDAWELEDLR